MNGIYYESAQSSAQFGVCSLCGVVKTKTHTWVFYGNEIVHLECLEKAMKKKEGNLVDNDKISCQTCGKVIEWASQIISFADHNRLFCSAVCRDDFILRSKAAKLFQEPEKDKVLWRCDGCGKESPLETAPALENDGKMYCSSVCLNNVQVGKAGQVLRTDGTGWINQAVDKDLLFVCPLCNQNFWKDTVYFDEDGKAIHNCPLKLFQEAEKDSEMSEVKFVGASTQTADLGDVKDSSVTKLPSLSVGFSESELSVLVCVLAPFSPQRMDESDISNKESRSFFEAYFKLREAQLEYFDREMEKMKEEAMIEKNAQIVNLSASGLDLE